MYITYYLISSLSSVLFWERQKLGLLSLYSWFLVENRLSIKRTLLARAREALYQVNLLQNLDALALSIAMLTPSWY